MLFNALNLIFLNVTMLNCTKKIFTQISLAGLYYNYNLQLQFYSLQLQNFNHTVDVDRHVMHRHVVAALAHEHAICTMTTSDYAYSVGLPHDRAASSNAAHCCQFASLSMRLAECEITARPARRALRLFCASSAMARSLQ